MSLFYTNSWASENEKIDVWSGDYHSVKLLEDGIAGLEARLELIRNATQFVEVETFIFDRGYSSRLFIHELVMKKKTNPNIRIRILIDATPNHKLFDFFEWSELKTLGIEFKLYNQAHFPNLNTRNHRKLIVSEHEAIVGGRNIADEYFSLSRIFNFIDRDVLVRGPIVNFMASSFQDFWDSSKSEAPRNIYSTNFDDYRSEYNKTSAVSSEPTPFDSPSDIYKYRVSMKTYNQKKLEAQQFMSPELQDIETQMLGTIHAEGQKALESQPWFKVSDIRFVSDGPDWDKPSATVTGPAIIEMMDSAEHRMTIENGYIIPDSKGWEIFIKHLKSKKDLFIYTNSRKAAQHEFIVNAMTLNHTSTLSSLGAQVYLNPGSLPAGLLTPFPDFTNSANYSTHAKSLVVDSKRCVIGSANFDPRSQKRMNAENALIIVDAPFCQHLETMIETRAAWGVELMPNGHAKSKVDVNKPETLGQGLLLMALPIFQVFEDWF